MKAIVFTCLITTAAASYGDTTCKQGDITRTVAVVYSEPGQAVPCEVIYNKPTEGGQQVLWRAFNEAGYCEARAEAFVEKLGSMGFACETTDDVDVEPEETAESG